MPRRIYPLLLLFLITVIIFTPWVAGIIFKKNYFHLIKIINKDNRIKLEVLEYTQGWLTSYSKIRVTLNTRAAPFSLSTPLTFILEENISHGPIIYDSLQHRIEVGYANVQTVLHIADNIETTLLGNVKSSGILQISTLAELNQDWKIHLHVPLLSLTTENNGKLSWYGLDGDCSIIVKNERIAHILIKLAIGSMIMYPDAQKPFNVLLNIRPTKYTYDAVHEEMGLWSGYSHVWSPAISLTQADGSRLVANKLALHNAFSITSETIYNTNVTMNIQNLQIPSHLLPDMSNLHIGIYANNFNSQGFTDYLKLFANKNTAANAEFDLNKFQTLMVQAITPTSYLNTDISFDTSFGSVAITSQTNWLPNSPAPTKLEDLLAYSSTKISITMSRAFVDKLAELYGFKSDPEVAKDESFKRLVSKQLYKNQINFADSLQILAIANQHQPPDQFESSLNYLNLPTDISNELKLSYRQQFEVKPSPPTTVAPPSSPAPKTQQQFVQDLSLFGYLSQDGNEYVTTLTLEKGVWKINGRVVNASPAAPAPIQVK